MSPERVADQAHESGALMDYVSFGSSHVLDYQREFEHFHGLLQKKKIQQNLNSIVRFMNIVLINSPLQKQQYYYVDHIPVSLHDL